jgi:hypothetical protein
LTEVSGLAWSGRDRNLLWTHNDSGNDARVFAVGFDGGDRGTVVIDNATAVDWEDIALQRGPAPLDVLWVADIGDNAARRDDVQLYRFPEPDAPGPGTTVHVTAEIVTLRYEDGPHDAEALLVDDRSGDVVIVTKEAKPPTGVYRAGAATSVPGAIATLERVGELTPAPGVGIADTLDQLGALGGLTTRVTGADASRAGRVVAVRSYGGVSVYPWPKRRSLVDALAGTPCAAPAPADPTHPQGESVALSPAGDAYATVSEGRDAPIVVVDRRDR